MNIINMPPENTQQLEERVKKLENIIFALVYSDRYIFDRDIDIGDRRNIRLSKIIGTKIGTATGQKLGFWNTTPVDQHEPVGVTLGFVDVGTGTEITEADTFTGNTGSSTYTIGDIVAALKLCGIIKA
ncbi:MAG TPA: hypothetical protein ENI23_10675 [bacterium]|nr:hypothetical protein [bacterium]